MAPDPRALEAAAMDDEPANLTDPHDPFARAREEVDAGAHDLLDEAAVPLLGLSIPTLAAVFLGGAVGTLARYLLAAHHPSGPGAFPWVTLLVNLSGSLAIGFLVPITEHVSHRVPTVRPFLMIGFLGGWTTYSTLAVDATLLARNGDVGTGLAYLAATVAGGLTLVVAGHAAARRLVAV